GDTPVTDVSNAVDADSTTPSLLDALPISTAADGSWSFANLDYTVAGDKVYEVLPSGYVQTVGTAGYTIVGTSGHDQTGLNFANFKKFTIAGHKYTDITGNEIRTAHT